MINTTQWEQPLIAVDVVPYFFDRHNRTVNTILVERQNEPHKNKYALPGVLLLNEEQATEAAYRALSTKVRVNPKNIKLLTDVGIIDNPNRDPRGPTLSIIFIAFIEGVLETANTKIIELNEATNTPLPFDHNKILERTNQHVLEKLLTNKPTTKALTGESFRTTELATIIETFNTNQPESLQIDTTNLSRKLNTCGWFDRAIDNETTPNLKGRPSTPWVFKQ